ncbi:hypothetical protein ABER61_25205 [Brevibacillus formosus]|uniref:BIG2 domain-containing protein n=1 Tax=Brevibacillus formosus TaxID=54913 RepID=A0A837KL48_9BACL|nr:hypothetical protein [Brevibacillus formosus]KLH98238.1 hypothetical protein AA984_14580 [Brevibacillus formosus]MED1956884.1 hypothetical protein [Brevibacillus formosus]PSJ96540.1 hypothetical protein C7R91_12375 [Brevibacillus formosus]GED59193.1 hypothetical protein BFO01nite_33250 [Brevibacillus formosus]
MKKAVLTLTALASIFSFNLFANDVSAASSQRNNPDQIVANSTMYSSISMRVGEYRLLAGDIVSLSYSNPTDCIGLDGYGKLTAFKPGNGVVVAEWNSGHRVVYSVTVTP